MGARGTTVPLAIPAALGALKGDPRGILASYGQLGPVSSVAR